MFTKTKICPVCQKRFVIKVHYECQFNFTRKTCSKECRYKIVQSCMKKENCTKSFTCKQCSKTFQDYSTNKRTFCSIKCKALWQKENLKGKNNPNWKPYNPHRSCDRTIRRQILQERKVCKHCKINENLQIHHIDRDRSNNHPDNILLLCQECHALEHEKVGEHNSARLIRNHPQTNGRKTRNPKPCKQCKELFHPYRDNMQFCSPKCSVRFRYKTPHKGRVCIYCKRTFRYKRRKQKFCSSSCRYSAISG